MHLFKGSKRILIVSALVVGIFLIGSSVALLAFASSYNNKIYPDVFIDGLNVGGKTKEEALKLLAEKDQQKTDSSITITYGTEVLKVLSLKSNTLFAENEKLVDESLTIGRSSNIIINIANTINATVKFSSNNIGSALKYDEADIEEFITAMEQQYNVAPQDAVFEYTNNRVNSIAKEISGKKINKQKFYTDLQNALNRLNVSAESSNVAIQTEEIKADKTLSSINDFGIENLIGQGQSNYKGSMETRVFNIKLATSKFNGVIIPAGKTISFGEIVGDISADSGYREAYVISGGQTVLDAGGGVCQVSTTLFRAALNTGLPITERNAHAYRVYYYEHDSLPGLDAAIYLPYLDLKIENNTKGAILITTEIDDANNNVIFKLWGKKDDRKIELSPIRVYDEQAAPAARYINDNTLPKGVVRQIEWATPGAKTVFTYKVTIEGKVVVDQEFFSDYPAWQAVYLVGQL